MPTFNLYCDESTHLENDKMPFLLIGFISVPYNRLDYYKLQIKKLKDKHYIFGELKWSKVSNSSFHFYTDLIKLFFESELAFRAIVVKKDRINNEKFDQSYDTFYYKMYYQLINHKIDMKSNYNIYLDIKDDLSAIKVKKLKDILNTKYGVIRNLQNILSRESLFLQLADVILGAINYNLRNEKKVNAKSELIKMIKDNSSHSLDSSTFKSESKFNLFFIELN